MATVLLALQMFIAGVALLMFAVIVGFAVYQEFFSPSRFSRPWDYLTPEEMEMIQKDHSSTT